MSDGMYDFYENIPGKGFAGSLRVRNGAFDGETLMYNFQGSFIVDGKVLKGKIHIKNKIEDSETELPLYSDSFQDCKFNIDLEVEGRKITFVCEKVKHLPKWR